MTSTIKVNKIEKENGSTLTLGGPSTAVTLACGATQTGFGRTGTVDWCTTAKTSPLTAESGKGYFVNTCGGAITVTLPSSPSAGDIVAFKDYANTWDTNAVTVGRGGSKINGNCLCATLNTESQSVTLIYVDGTKGWQDIHDSTSNVTGSGFITATGGTITTVDTNFKVHTFTGSGTFCVSAGGGPLAKIDYMVVAGGAGGATGGGGGGAGGYRESSGTSTGSFTVSPLGACVAAIQGSVASFPITVGAGGAAGPGPNNNTTGASGGVSTFSTITSAGGGGGGKAISGADGGSGGGTYGVSGVGSGNTPPVSPPQGNDGGTQGPEGQGAGGGATGAGGNGAAPQAGAGGTGATSSINGTPTARAGGGGGGGSNCAGGGTATSGGGAGGTGPGPGGPGTATAGTANTGGGGGGGGIGGPGTGAGGAGGSGIVILRYKFQ
jgi:hypothetical protein